MMSDSPEKVVIPSAEEVAQYGGKSDAAGTGERGSEVDVEVGQPEPAGTPGETSSTESDWKDIALRARAELSNYQKRMEKDRSDALRYANASLVKALLPVLDNLERVIQTASDAPGSIQALVDGVKLTLDLFEKILREYHVEAIAGEGQPFDPQVHEAMMERPSDHPERVVLQEVSKGYKLHDRVLRPSKVIVSKPMAEAAREPASDE